MTEVVIIVRPNVREDSGQAQYWVAQRLAQEILDRYRDEVLSAEVKAT